jgi:hypothetical protein
MTAPFIPTDFTTLDVSSVKRLLPSLPDASDNRHFIDGDHFNNGDDWVGPGPRVGDKGHQDFLDLLAKAFVSKNAMDEICDRLVSAILGREPRWAWVPRRKVTKKQPITDAEQALIDEVETALTDWWDTRQAHKELKKLLKFMLWAREATYRLYVPSGLTDSSGSIGSVGALSDALSKIFLEIPDPESATVWTNPNTMQRLGIVVYKDTKGTEIAELTYLQGEKTVVKIVPGGEVSEGGGNFGGHLTMFRIALDDAFLTEQLRSLQRMLNMTLTLLGKGLVDNHFVEKLFKDILPPGHWEYEEDGKTRRAFIVDEGGRSTGGRTDSYMQSIDYRNEQGNTVLANGQIVFRDPVDPTGTIKGSEYWYQCMLEEARQDHILINQSSTPSGKSREEARADFASSGEDSEMQATIVGRELLLTVVSMAEAFMGSAGKYTQQLKPIFQPRTKYGELSIEERKQSVDEAEKGFRADETAMSDIGINDVDAESSLIQSSQRGTLRIASERADVVEKWAADFPREVALKLAGFTDDEIKDIMKLVSQAEADDPGLPDPTQQNPTPSAKPSVVPPVTAPTPIAGRNGRQVAGR